MKTKETSLHIFEIALAIGMAIFLLFSASALRARDQLADKVVRLHILANSDSQEDQALKLLVRDRILEQAAKMLEGSSSRSEAETLLRRELPALEQAAEAELAANGCHYPVTAELADTVFPTREYDGFTLPAGKYMALRVVIGEGAGHNWWCVVFPPLCTAATAGVPASTLTAGFTEDEVKLVTEENERYILKFKLIELWEALQHA